MSTKTTSVLVLTRHPADQSKNLKECNGGSEERGGEKKLVGSEACRVCRGGRLREERREGVRARGGGLDGEGFQAGDLKLEV